ncbi:hypothetical protein D3C84_1256120 [compost metagenome]
MADCTPGSFKAMSLMRRITASVRSSDAPLGNCVKPIRYCLSCAGTKPPGTALKRPKVSAISARYIAIISALRESTRRTPPL